MASRHIPGPRTLVIAALCALAALAALPALASAATPATLRLVETDAAFRETTVTMPDGTTFRTTPGLFRLRVTPAGGASATYRGACVDGLHAISSGRDYEVSLRTAADDPSLASARYGEAAWLLHNSDSLVAAASDRGLEAGAIQLAVWQLTDQARETSPTGNARLNARTSALRALAAGRGVAGPLAASAPAAPGCAGRGTVTVGLTGTPGSEASVAVTGGTGTVAPSTVTFAADGTALVAVASATPGVVTVTATAEGGTLTRAARASAGRTTPQETAMLVPRTFRTSVPVTFGDCSTGPLGGDDVPPATPGPGDPGAGSFEIPAPPKVDQPAGPLETPDGPRRTDATTPRYDIVKSGPRRVRAGATARYAITIVNRGAATLRGATVADVLPTGMSLVAVPAGARLRKGSVEWSVAPLRPGARRTLHVNVRIDADATGRRCNRARVSAPGGAVRTSSACTRVIPLIRVLRPAVTA